MKKNEFGKQLTAIIICCVSVILMAALYIYDRGRQQEAAQVYETVMKEQQQQKEKRELEALDLESRKQEALVNFSSAVETYLPGIVFYGDSLTEGVGGNGVNYPSILYSLIRNEICDTKTAFVNIMTLPNNALYAKYFPIIFIGTDSNWNGDIPSLIQQQKELIGDRDRYIIIGIPTGTREERAELEAAMVQEYGDRYINIREYMSTDGLESLELEIHPEDERAMQKGSVPPSFMNADMIHLNDNGYKLVAFLTYDRMTQLGYFEEISQAAKIITELNGGSEE